MTGVAEHLFTLDGERNIPTYFSSFVLLLASVLLYLVTILKRLGADRYRNHWAALSLIFLLLSIEELVGLHEISGQGGGRATMTPEPAYYAPSIFTAALVVLFTIAFFRFAFHLSHGTRVLFVWAAALYVGGALGAEMVESIVDQTRGPRDLLYIAVTTVEESMELAGAILFVYALLGFLANELQRPLVRFTSSLR